MNVDQLALKAFADDVSGTVGLVDAGRRIVIFDERDGWYRIEAPLTRTLEYVFGWVPATQDGVQTLTAVSVACPESMSLGFLGAMHREEMRVCAGSAEIGLAGSLTRLDRSVIFVGEPEWLAHESAIFISVDYGPAAVGGSLFLHVLPESGADLVLGVPVHLLGHFSDMAAGDCVRMPLRADLPAESAMEQLLWCQQQFVVTSIDPD